MVGVENMGRRLGAMLVVMAVALSVPAYGRQGSISGRVKNAAGTPQMGAMVQAIGYGAAKTYTVFTDDKGAYLLPELLPGTYDLKVSAASFLPTLRENVTIKSGATLVVNLTLNTLGDAIRMLPTKQGTEEDDDWKWTLRSVANRPILRMKNGQPVVVSNGQDKTMRAAVAFVAGSDGEGFGGSSELSTRFNMERSLFQTGLLSFNGDVGYGPGANATVFRTTYSHQLSNGSRPEASVSVRRFATSPTTVVRDAALESLTARMSDTINVADFIELTAGTEFQAVQFMGRVSSFNPFGSMDVHVTPNTVLELQYATTTPNMRQFKGYDTAPADLSEAGPSMTLNQGQAVLQRARHQEVSLSHRFGKTAVQAAYYGDRIHNAAVTGVGNVDGDFDVLPDVYSGTFAYNGGSLEAHGARVVVARQLGNGLTATMDYSFGGVLDLDPSELSLLNARSSISTVGRHALAFKVAGKLNSSKTQWIASYKWTSGSALTPVDLFNAGPGQADPYLNIFIRQQLPGTGFMPGKFEALVDLRNLLAQGYRPMVGSDGETLYLVQAARSVRGGVAFVF